MNIRPRLLELDRLVREARDEIIKTDADPDAVDLLEALLALASVEGQYRRMCEGSGLTVDDSPELKTLLDEMRGRVTRTEAPEPALGRYAGLVMARAAAEASEDWLGRVGVRAQRLFGVNPFQDD